MTLHTLKALEMCRVLDYHFDSGFCKTIDPLLCDLSCLNLFSWSIRIISVGAVTIVYLHIAGTRNFICMYFTFTIFV